MHSGIISIFGSKLKFIYLFEWLPYISSSWYEEHVKLIIYAIHTSFDIAKEKT